METKTMPPDAAKPTLSSEAPPAIGLPVEIVQIQTDTYIIGDDNSTNSNEMEHRVTISPFKMGKYEVTQRQYEEVMGTNPSYLQGDSRPPATGEAQGSRPVKTVTWLDAVNFCNALSKKEGKTPVYTINDSKTDVTLNSSANGYRLQEENILSFRVVCP